MPDEAYLPVVYKMVIDISGDRKRVFVFRHAGCRRKMLQWYYGYLDKAAESEKIKSIRVWGTVGNKTDVVLEWARARATRRGTAARRLSTPVTPTPMAELPTRWPTTTQGTTAR